MESGAIIFADCESLSSRCKRYPKNEAAAGQRYVRTRGCHAGFQPDEPRPGVWVWLYSPCVWSECKFYWFGQMVDIDNTMSKLVL